MNEQQIDKLINMLEKLGGAGGHAWQQAVRLEGAQGWYMAGLAGVMLLVLSICVFVAMREWLKARDGDADVFIAAVLIGFTAFLFAAIFGYDAFSSILAPEGVLAKELLEKVK